MNSLIDNVRNQIISICKLLQIRSMYVFGSATTSSFDDNSDIDFLIEFQPNVSIEDYTENYFQLHYKLRQLLHREIDIVTKNSLSNIHFIEKVDKQKQFIYEA